MRGSETVIIHRERRKGLHGGMSKDNDETVTGCIIYPTQSVEEDTNRQDVVLSRLTVVFGSKVDISATNEVTARGGRHVVVGAPQVYIKGTTLKAIIVNLEMTA